MKKIISMIFLLVSMFTSLNAIDVVSNKTNIYLQTENGDIRSEDLKGKFTLLWFYDVNCHYCASSMGEFTKVLNFIENNHSDDINVIVVSVVPRNFSLLNKYLEDNGLIYQVTSSRIGNDYMNDYMNIKATPTMIMLDPYLSIVDKIEGTVLSPIYNRHIDYIMNKYYETMDTGY